MIERLEAEERLMDLTVADYPNTKADGRRKIHNSLTKIVKKTQPKEEISTADFAKKLGIDKWQTKEPQS